MKHQQVYKRDQTTRETHAVSVPDDKEGNPIFRYLLQGFSTFTKIRRVLAYVHRIVEVTRRKAVPKGSLTVQEVKRTEDVLKTCEKNHQLRRTTSSSDNTTLLLSPTKIPELIQGTYCEVSKTKLANSRCFLDEVLCADTAALSGTMNNTLNRLVVIIVVMYDWK